MRTSFLLTAGVLAVAFSAPPSAAQTMEIEALTPIIFVDEIEPCIGFWTDLGFANIGEVPHDDKIGFVMLQKDGVMIMYQSYASAEADIPGVVERPLRSTTALYVRVKQLDPIKAQLEQGNVVVEERVTFYGAREIFVRATCGTTVAFSEMQDEG